MARTYYRVEVHGLQAPYPKVPGSMKRSGDMAALFNAIDSHFDPAF